MGQSDVIPLLSRIHCGSSNEKFYRTQTYILTAGIQRLLNFNSMIQIDAASWPGCDIRFRYVEAISKMVYKWITSKTTIFFIDTVLRPLFSFGYHLAFTPKLYSIQYFINYCETSGTKIIDFHIDCHVYFFTLSEGSLPTSQ